jgi:hypothetical protein
MGRRAPDGPCRTGAPSAQHRRDPVRGICTERSADARYESKRLSRVPEYGRKESCGAKQVVTGRKSCSRISASDVTLCVPSRIGLHPGFISVSGAWSRFRRCCCPASAGAGRADRNSGAWFGCHGAAVPASETGRLPHARIDAVVVSRSPAASPDGLGRAGRRGDIARTGGRSRIGLCGWLVPGAGRAGRFRWDMADRAGRRPSHLFFRLPLRVPGNLPRRGRSGAAAPADARRGSRGFRRIPRSWRRRAGPVCAPGGGGGGG